MVDAWAEETHGPGVAEVAPVRRHVECCGPALPQALEKEFKVIDKQRKKLVEVRMAGWLMGRDEWCCPAMAVCHSSRD